MKKPTPKSTFAIPKTSSRSGVNLVRGVDMSHGWNSTPLTTEQQALDVLTELRGKRWLCRGHSEVHDCLVPKIDRKPREALTRSEKLSLERQSNNLFRATARFFSHPGEEPALTNDIVALMVLRHYGVPCRLLDWSWSPWVAAYFAVCDHDEKDGELWTFDYSEYVKMGDQQWKKCPETTSDGSGDGKKFDARLTAFTVEEPKDWFICGFYNDPGFHRQNAQEGVYTMTARFGRDHAEAIANLLADSTRYSRYVVPKKLKPKLRSVLRESHGIWRGSLFPDSAGAAEIASTVFSEPEHLCGAETGRE